MEKFPNLNNPLEPTKPEQLIEPEVIKPESTKEQLENFYGKPLNEMSRTPFFRQCFGEFFSPFLLSR